MSMNILNISKEIKKINNTLDILQSQNNDIKNNNLNLNNITNEIKNNMNDINSKIENLYDFNINTKVKYENTNYDTVKDFLKSINIEEIIINKYNVKFFRKKIIWFF